MAVQLTHHPAFDHGTKAKHVSTVLSQINCPKCLTLLKTRKVSALQVPINHQFTSHQIEQLQLVFNRINAGEKITLLTGAAGTGKTTLMQAVISAATAAGRRVIQMTPTGKAAVRLTEKTGKLCRTIHGSIYGEVREDEDGKLIWLDPGLDTLPGDVVVVDEASMVGTQLATDLFDSVPTGTSILLVGDPNQLPPVNDGQGVYNRVADAHLEEIHRQALDHPVLALATAVRNSMTKGIEHLRQYSNTDSRLVTGQGQEQLITQAARDVINAVDSIVLCYTNEEKDRLNQEIRKLLGRRQKIEPGDRIIIRTNNHRIGMMNGEIYTVESSKIYTHKVWGRYATVKLKERKKPVMISLAHFGCERKEWWEHAQKLGSMLPITFVHADYGFAITVHSSQGSEWKHVYYWWEPLFSYMIAVDPDTAKKMLYTAVTRASEKLVIHR
jgi:exodeoxyribonuclease-5